MNYSKEIKDKNENTGDGENSEKRIMLNGIAGSKDAESVSNQRKLFENQADHWLTTKEAAEYLRITAKTLLNLTSNGKIRYFKFGRRNRFLLIDLRNLLLANSRGGSYGY